MPTCLLRRDKTQGTLTCPLSVVRVMGINKASQRRFFAGQHSVPVQVSRAGMHRLSRYL
jgi:hypothetical protein